jgi:hypothetical protein
VSRRYGLHDRGTGVQFAVKAENLYCTQYSECLIWVPWVKAAGHAADRPTTHSYLMPRLKTRGATPPVPSPISLRAAVLHTQTGTHTGVRPLHVSPNCSVIKCLVFLGVHLAVMSKMAILSVRLHSRRVLQSVAVTLGCLPGGELPSAVQHCASTTALQLKAFSTSLPRLLFINI